MPEHSVVDHEQWLAARKALLEREKAFTREREAIAAARRELPWERVEKDYRFEDTHGVVDLVDLFGPHSQLIVYHFMFDDDWKAGCKSCSFWADNYNGTIDHLAARDVAFVGVSKAPLVTLHSFRERMGWRFRWVRSEDNIFGKDYGVSFSADQLESGDAPYNYGTTTSSMPELPGLSVFAREGNDVFHTYSCYARGLDILNSAYHHLDMVPRGRDEAGLPFSMAWVKLHDEY